MTNPAVLPQPETVCIRFASLLREAHSKHNAPYAGFSLPGAPPVVVPRKLLKSSIAGLTDAQVRVVIRAGQNLYDKTTLCNGVLGLEIRSIDGRRRDVLYSQHWEIRPSLSAQHPQAPTFPSPHPRPLPP